MENQFNIKQCVKNHPVNINQDQIQDIKRTIIKEK